VTSGKPAVPLPKPQRINLERLREYARRGWARLRQALRHPRERLVVILLAVLGLGSCTVGSALGAWTTACLGTCIDVEQVETFEPRQASHVLDASGGLVGSFHRERRTVVPIGSLPRYVPMAFVAIEDARFFEHEGVDVFRVIGAIRDNVMGGFGASGGSTITMQLARNLFPQQLPPNEKSMRRKLAEAKLALQMERRLPKRRILELYLNHIYLGAGAYGIEAAARTYFDKPASQLSPLEAATLAGLPQAPSAYNPREHPERAIRRRNRVLDMMARINVITVEQAAQMKTQPLHVAPPRGALHAPYFVEQVRRQLEPMFGELLYTGGLRIHTALDPTLQKTAEESLEQQIRQIEAGTYGGFRHPTYERFAASLQPGQVVRHTPYLQGLVVVMDPNTGAVRALVGGRDWRHSQFNRATQAIRQPGSAFKPFVFAAALETGHSPSSGVSDGPLTIGDWSPRNYDGKYGGSISMRAALRHSRNLPTVRLGIDAGIDAVRDVARRAGVKTPIPGYPSVYIGAAGVYPMELIAAYAAFGNGGYQVTPQFVTRVEDHEGHLLWQAPSLPPQTVDPAIGWILTDMLREVVDRGTGYPVRDPGVGNIPYDIPIAGKTGTTNDATDVWFVGYTPDVLAGVWLGLDNPQSIMPNATGGVLASPIWARVVRQAYQGRPNPEPWVRPRSVVERKVSGGRIYAMDCAYVGGYVDIFAAAYAEPSPCVPPPVQTDSFIDPTPELPGRPVFPGQPRVPSAEELEPVTPGNRD
jgi:1A family penicillin-binding protein